MRRLWAIAVLSLALSCIHRHAGLGRFFSAVQRVYYVNTGVSQPSVDLGHKSSRNVIARAAREIGGGVAEVRLHDKLTAAVSATALGDQVRSTVQDALALRQRFNAVGNQEPCDASIETSVTDFGIAADSPDSVPYVVLGAQLVMYDCASRSAVWDGTARFGEPITNPYFRIERLSATAGVIANVAALEALRPEEWAELYRVAAATAGSRLADQLIKEATHAH
jgi:hypothetical protein